MIFLDSAATSFLKPQAVYRAMENAMKTMSSPGRGSYSAAIKAADAVYECRETACRLFSFDKPENVVFTQNASHALNIAIRSTVKKGDTVLISGYEHNSVTRTLHGIGANVLVAECALFDSEGAYRAFKKLIPQADVVICNHVSNVFGFILPIYDIADLCNSLNKPLIVDVSQSAGIIDIDMRRLNASFLCMPGHKGLLGPQGTGIIICDHDVQPLLYGGTGSDSIEQNMPSYLPDMLEAGTHNVVGIAGLNAGMKYVMKRTPSAIGEYEIKLKDLMSEEIRKIPDICIFSSLAGNQAGVLSVRHGRIDSETLCERLGRDHIAARCGLHCSPLAHKSAGTIDSGTLRFSFSPFITPKEVITASNALKRIILEEK